MVQLSLCKCPSRMRSQLPESTCIVALQVLWRGQPDDGESCIVLESGLTHSFVVKIPQHWSLVVYKFCAASRECCKQDYGRMCVKLCCWMLWCLNCIRIITAMYVHITRILHGGRLHKGPKTPQNCQNQGVGTCAGIGTCLGRYITSMLIKLMNHLEICSCSDIF